MAVNLLPFWIKWKVRILTGAVVLALLGGMYFYAYKAGEDACQDAHLAKVEEQAAADLALTTREARVNQREAEIKLDEFEKDKVVYRAVYERVEQNAKANPNPSCGADAQFVRDIGEILNR